MSFVPPSLPDDLDSIDEDGRSRTSEQFRRRHVHFFYLGFTQRMNEPHWHALEQETSVLKRRIFDDAGHPWESLNLTLQMDLVRVWQNWSKVASPNTDGTISACPIAVTEQEAERRTKLSDSLLEVDSDMEEINRALGIASDEWTRSESSEAAKEGARVIKAQGLAAVSDDPWIKEMTEKHWPSLMTMTRMNKVSSTPNMLRIFRDLLGCRSRHEIPAFPQLYQAKRSNVHQSRYDLGTNLENRDSGSLANAPRPMNSAAVPTEEIISARQRLTRSHRRPALQPTLEARSGRSPTNPI